MTKTDEDSHRHRQPKLKLSVFLLELTKNPTCQLVLLGECEIDNEKSGARRLRGCSAARHIEPQQTALNTNT